MHPHMLRAQLQCDEAYRHGIVALRDWSHEPLDSGNLVLTGRRFLSGRTAHLAKAYDAAR
jgi:hypothetical protein